MERVTPSPVSNLVFRAKVLALQTRRLASDLAVRLEAFEAAPTAAGDVLVELRSRLWREDDPREWINERGKVHNLRVAANQLNGLSIPAGKTFSFWKHIGRTTRRKGYVYGRQIQEGCLIPARGGGICQLTNMLYEAALKAECQIVERHPHTRQVPNAPVNKPDATVAWNHIDLRFRPPQDLLLKVFLTADELVVQFVGEKRSKRTPLPLIQTKPSKAAASCASCGMDDCFRHKPVVATAGRRAVLVDRVWPEFVEFLQAQDLEEDLLLLPLDPRRFQRQAYEWPVEQAGEIQAATFDTLYRSWRSRRLASEGAARRKAALEADEALAKAYAQHLGPDVIRLTVYQQFLPFLWRDGHLGGRHYDVLMTRFPIAELQARLDAAAKASPEQKSLADFRAGDWIARAEQEALRQADRIITPHAEIAALFSDRAVLIPWHLPVPKKHAKGDAIAFPGPAIARKGSEIVRDVARELGRPVILAGSDLEKPGFWEGVEMRRPKQGEHWLDGAACVLQPAVMEDQSRKLLEALACGVPVVATQACGISPQEGLTLIDPRNALEATRLACS
ncbi:MAG: hypothetical protein QOJ65_36 [Fimbriimonadaceae bacterium]|jgi:hypothetical protein|nr:hypothetical protein [Fimbriimonadaceae bacterium]